MAAEADQQLSLAAALGLPEESPPATNAGRPRTRQASPRPAPEAPPAASADSPTEPDSDLPPWHHHGLVEP